MISVFLLILLSLVFQTINKSPTTSVSRISPTPTIIIATSSSQLVKVDRVIDGDTIKIETGQSVRYIGIDTPELHDPRKPVQCFAKEAYEKNKQLVEGKTVRLEKDVSETDKYGRLLRYIFLPQIATAEALFVNKYLVTEGFAFAATFPPDVRYAELFKNEQKQAMESKKGLWQGCVVK
jgi:micrococcal nuclease